MPFFLWIFIAILLFAGALVFMILLILGLTNKNWNRSIIMGSLFILFLGGGIFSAYMFATETSQKVRGVANTFKKELEKAAEEADIRIEQRDSRFLDSLASWTQKQLQDSIPLDFFSSNRSNGKARVPLFFPFEIRKTEFGYIVTNVNNKQKDTLRGNVYYVIRGKGAVFQRKDTTVNKVQWGYLSPNSDSIQWYNSKGELPLNVDTIFSFEHYYRKSFGSDP